MNLAVDTRAIDEPLTLQQRARVRLARLRRQGGGDLSESALDAIAARFLSQPDAKLPEAAEMPALPLYAADDIGSWSVNSTEYTTAQAAAWLAREVEACRSSVVYFASHYAYTINEHLDDTSGQPPSVELVPVGVSSVTGKPWTHTNAVLNAFHPRRDVIVEKSRDMMVSWLCMIGVLHDLLFQRHWATMTLSRVETLVDDGGEASTIDSLHGKIRFLWDRLPGFLRSQPLSFRYLQIRNEANDCHVTGFSATPSAGRGPKWQRAIIDEFAWVPHSEMVMASVARACPQGKMLVSTPHGKNNAFARVVHQSSRQVFPQVEQKNAHWERLTIHWTQHPERDQAWYDAQQSSGSMTEEAVAQELDISYTRSLGRRCYPKFVYDLHVAGGALAPLPVVAYEPNRPLYICCDWNADPLIWVILQPRPGPVPFCVIGEICRRNAICDDAVREFAFRFASRERVDQLVIDHPDWPDTYGIMREQAGEGGHQGMLIVVGDATEEKSTVYSRVKMYQHLKHSLQSCGFQVVLKVPASNPPRKLRFETVNDVLAKNLAVFDPTCEQVIKDFEEGVWDGPQTDMNQGREDDDGSGLTRSHASSALGYGLCILHKIQTSAAPPQSRARPRPALKDLMGEVARRW